MYWCIVVEGVAVSTREMQRVQGQGPTWLACKWAYWMVTGYTELLTCCYIHSCHAFFFHQLVDWGTTDVLWFSNKVTCRTALAHRLEFLQSLALHFSSSSSHNFAFIDLRGYIMKNQIRCFLINIKHEKYKCILWLLMIISKPKWLEIKIIRLETKLTAV